MLLPRLGSPQAQRREFGQCGRFGDAVSREEAIARRIWNGASLMRFRNLDATIVKQNLAAQFGLRVHWICRRTDLHHWRAIEVSLFDSKFFRRGERRQGRKACHL